jgi:pSer/pThr/pTyr-binding forkhead associated (FHA) protein
MDTLVLVDVTDAHGMMLSRQRFRLEPGGPPLLIGRDVACEVVLNDPYVAGRHASLALGADGVLRLTDTGSVNGLIVGDRRVREVLVSGAGSAAQGGTWVQVGHSHLRLRSGAEPLPPERRDRESLRSRRREYGVAVLGALGAGGFALFTGWIDAPDDPVNAGLLRLLAGAAVLAAWFGGWFLLGRAVRSRWQWTGNAAVTLGAAALGLWLWWGTDATVFGYGTARARALGIGLMLLVAIVAVYLEVRIATRLRRPGALAIAVMAALVAGLGLAWSRQPSGADVNRLPPVGRLFPPDWSRQPGVRVDKFVDEALDLKDAADREGTGS